MKTISDQTSNDIDKEIHWTSIAAVLNLGNVIELIDHGIDDRQFARQDLVNQVHQAVLHVGLDFGDELHIEGIQQLVEQWL